MSKVEKIRYSYDQIHEIVKKMAEKITEKYGKIDIIISIATGGWIPARILRTFLPHSEQLPLPLYSIGIINYDSRDKLLSEAIIVQELPAKLNLEGKNVLLVDEVADSGGTFIKAAEYIESKNPEKLRTAVLHLKEQSSFKPDIVGEFAGNNWIVYPWDAK
ncbi:MAG: phosphoribosyltransferase [Candidatus Cloacimonetes bacterium]|nr:phosphoribosyltransferase [Candidatus Cloacimonadota bacterium]MCF7813187.1 phosphoribosyltransferase [Candidatus Cloacimonadota bacterium]MCF7867635.1 phosphoribosyltransferase [Candidatus Cloacimonadota bacterium]MCF7883090.1 phosphoribosyltransferase [Candidatus Cloacimonadota bacterium]